MAKKKTPRKTARKPAVSAAKRIGKKPAKLPLAKPTKSLTKGTIIKAVTTRKQAIKPATPPLVKPAKSPATDKTEAAITTSKPAAESTKDTSIDVAAPASRQPTEELAKPEHTWVVWQDGRGIWAGTLPDFRNSKRPETIVCDVIDRGSQQGAAALHRAIQLGETLRQTYANYMKYWLQYDDAAQRQRIQEWYDRLGER